MGTLMDSLTTKIQRAEQRFDESAQTTVQRAVELGKLLTEAKAKIEHGGWEAWCQKTFAGRRSQSWIQNVMKVARDCEQNPELMRLQSLRAIAAASKPERSHESETSSKAQRAVHLDDAEHPVENAEQVSTAMPESMPEQSSGQTDPLAVAETEADNETVAAIAKRIIKDFQRLRAKNDPVVEAAVDEIRDVVGASPSVAESTPVTSKVLKYSTDEAMAAIDVIEASLKSGQKKSFNDQMARRWVFGDKLTRNSKPKDYLPALPEDETALTILNREFKHRFSQLTAIDPWLFRTIAEQKMLKETMNKAREVINEAEQHICSAAGKRSLFEGEEDGDQLAASA